MSFLFENLYKFNEEKGSKAFSYFSVITKNFLIQKVKCNKKKNQTDVSLDKNVICNLEKIDSNMVIMPYESMMQKKEFWILLKDEIKRWKPKFSKEQDKTVLDGVMLLLNSPELIEILNKKGIYLYLREITNLNTKQIVNSLNKFRRKYLFFKKKYLSGMV